MCRLRSAPCPTHWATWRGRSVPEVRSWDRTNPSRMQPGRRARRRRAREDGCASLCPHDYELKVGPRRACLAVERERGGTICWHREGERRRSAGDDRARVRWRGRRHVRHRQRIERGGGGHPAIDTVPVPALLLKLRRGRIQVVDRERRGPVADEGGDVLAEHPLQIRDPDRRIVHQPRPDIPIGGGSAIGEIAKKGPAPAARRELIRTAIW